MTPSPSPLSRHAPSMLLVAALHALVIYLLLESRTVHVADAPETQGPRIQWLHAIAPKAATARARVVSKPEAHMGVVRLPAPKTAQAPASAPAQAAPAAPDSMAEQATAVAAQTRPSAADILAQAKRDVGKIDKDLRKEFPQRGEQKFDDTAFKRMQQGFAEAYAAVPPKWYEASKIEELGSNTAMGGRTYKITSALGTLCVTTGAGKNGETMIGNCPK